MAISGHKARSIFDRYDIVSERNLLTAAQRLSECEGRGGAVEGGWEAIKEA